MCAVPFPPSRIPVVNVGYGPDGFIFGAAHLPNLRATDLYQLVGACSENDGYAEWVAKRLRLTHSQVGTDFEAAIRTARKSCKEGLVLSCTLPKGLHRSFITRAVQLGVKTVISDKPICPDWAEYQGLKDELAKAGAQAVVTFNHNYMTPALALRALVAKVGEENVTGIDSGFLQDWLMTDPRIRQSGWRLKDPYGGLTDIGSHAGMLAWGILGVPIEAGFDVEMSTAGKHGAKCFDNGTIKLGFRNGLQGTTRFHQALEGHTDDIYACVSFKNGV